MSTPADDGDAGRGSAAPASGGPTTTLAELAGLFARLGVTAFGGPAAHIAMMQDEVVNRRKWMTEARFLDLLGATHLIPGPNSTEMAIHIGFARRRWAGLVVAGLAFIVPAMAITGALAWAYVRFGALPAMDWLLYGVKPVILAVVVQAIWSLAPKAARTPALRVLALVAASLVALGVDELAVLFAAGVVASIATTTGGGGPAPAPCLLVSLAPAAATGALGGVTLPGLFAVFLKIGAVLFGSGYVLLAFLRADFVDRLGWLSEAQLLDAVAVGQITPGPVFTTATFIGYVLAGASGALVATAGIFLPAFVFVALSGPLVPRLRASPRSAAFLDGVNAASLALMAVVTAQLAGAALVDAPTLGLGLVSAVLLVRFRINATWLVLGGAAAGWLMHTLR
ncbi:chromate transporter [Nannocystis exedens]|uniref:Chromate transporter n=1 Tax=Nannocystis exedens TaxID=54 RepID=A0A1I2CX74_9BACT|nr:chromate efflux transporter [Nannocystis exedens]PCC68641.1 chromate transporter [Nannocystis exedens]SFE72901.1 chromate transporter [Nannocystis exedens]